MTTRGRTPMADQWYYAAGGQQQQGPTSIEALVSMIRQGRLNAGDLVWRDGMGDWLPASQVPELAGAFGGGIPLAPPAQPAPAPYPGAYPGGGGGGYPAASGGAMQYYSGQAAGGQSYAKEAQTA